MGKRTFEWIKSISFRIHVLSFDCFFHWFDSGCPSYDSLVVLVLGYVNMLRVFIIFLLLLMLINWNAFSSGYCINSWYVNLYSQQDRKCTYSNYTDMILDEAIDAVRTGELSERKASTDDSYYSRPMEDNPFSPKEELFSICVCVIGNFQLICLIWGWLWRRISRSNVLYQHLLAIYLVTSGPDCSWSDGITSISRKYKTKTC